MKVGFEVLSLEKFWDFSLKFYPLDSNQSDFLRLQDEANLNVNQCLLFFFLIEHRFMLSTQQCSALNMAIEESEQATEQLRRKRKLLGETNKSSQQYREALEAEIASERTQQKALVDCLKTFEQLEYVDVDTSEKVITDYLLACMNHLALARNQKTDEEFGQSIFECIEVCTRRLVTSYLVAKPFVSASSS